MSHGVLLFPFNLLISRLIHLQRITVFIFSEEQKEEVKEGDRNFGSIASQLNAKKLILYEKILLRTSGAAEFSIKRNATFSFLIFKLWFHYSHISPQFLKTLFCILHCCCCCCVLRNSTSLHHRDVTECHLKHRVCI